MQAASKVFAQRLQRRAEAPHTSVLEYGYEQPERDANPEQTVKLARLVFSKRQLLSELSDAEARSRLMEDGLVAQFSRTHPQTFLQMSAHEGAARALQTLEGLARFRQQVEREAIPEEEAMVEVTRFLMAQSSSLAKRCEEAAGASLSVEAKEEE